MTDLTFSTLRLTRTGGVLRVSVDVPPVNLMTAQLMLDLDSVASDAENDENLHVIIVESSDPEFFIAHGDMAFADRPDEFGALPIATHVLPEANPMMRLFERWRRLPQTTIAQIEGLARGGGAEFASALDLRFAAIETAGFGQFETMTGIVPGAGATAHLPRLIGRARALEVVLTGELIDAATAERWGWVNRALPAAELAEFVERAAHRIAMLAPGVRAAAAAAVDAASQDLESALLAENRLLGETFVLPASGVLTRAALAAGAQTRPVELRIEEMLAANLYIQH